MLILLGRFALRMPIRGDLFTAVLVSGFALTLNGMLAIAHSEAKKRGVPFHPLVWFLAVVLVVLVNVLIFLLSLHDRPANGLQLLLLISLSFLASAQLRFLWQTRPGSIDK